MFVENNTLPALKKYFNTKLSNLYSDREINYFLKLSICKRLNLTSTEFLLFNDGFSESDLLFFRDVVKRLIVNEPFQYILGECAFHDIDLLIAPGALIPRPETAELVDWIIEDLEGGENVLDLCTGSGCIAFALKSRFKFLNVKAGEFSNDAIEVFKQNQEYLKLVVEIVKMDALSESDYNTFDEKSFDVIVSNPPYIPWGDKEEMKENVLDFEPHLALFVDNDPLEFYTAIASSAMKYLKNRGILYFEIHERFGCDVIEMLKEKGFVNIELRKDLQGKDRMVKAQSLFSRHE